MHRRLAAAVALSAALLLSACTNNAPQPPPPPSGGPTLSSGSPTSSGSPSPASPSPKNKKHEDLLHIQELYKAEFADETRVLKAGGSNRLPRSIRDRTSGVYQQVVLDSFREEKKNGQRMTVGAELVGIAMDKWSPASVTFQACVDFTGVRTVNNKGVEVGDGPGSRVVQTYKVLKRHGTWRIDSASGKAVKDFETAPCNGTWYT